MLFLDYLYNLPNSTTGLDSIVVDTVKIFPAFVPLILFFVFLVVFIGGITRQKTRTGVADYSTWAIIASIATLLPALLFSINVGYIEYDVLIIVVTLNIMSAVWFFLDRGSSDI